VTWRNTVTSAPPFQDDNKNDPLPASPAVQAIITSYKFTCDCAITSWETYVESGKNKYQNGEYDISFQVWRPSPTVSEDGCYSLVGENLYPSITFSGGGTVSVSPDYSYVTAQPGDVIGYYTNFREGDNNGIQLEDSNDYSDNLILFRPFSTGESITRNNNECPLNTGNGGVLMQSTNAAPALRISISE